MEFFNHNSFVIIILFIWVMALLAVRKSGWGRRGWLILGGLTVLLAAGYLAFRPAGVANDQAVEIRAQIGQGLPVLLEFRSQN